MCVCVYVCVWCVFMYIHIYIYICVCVYSRGFVPTGLFSLCTALPRQSARLLPAWRCLHLAAPRQLGRRLGAAPLQRLSAWPLLSRALRLPARRRPEGLFALKFSEAPLFLFVPVDYIIALFKSLLTSLFSANHQGGAVHPKAQRRLATAAARINRGCAALAVSPGAAVDLVHRHRVPTAIIIFGCAHSVQRHCSSLVCCTSIHNIRGQCG